MDPEVAPPGAVEADSHRRMASRSIPIRIKTVIRSEKTAKFTGFSRVYPGSEPQ
jgi:hypothetical protein